MKKILIASAFALAFAAHAETVTLKYASFLPATTSNNSVTLPKVKEKLEAESGGTLTMEFFPGGTLGAGAKTQMRLVMNGGADAAEIPVPYNPGRIAGIDVFELPNLSKDNTDASLITMKMIESGEMSGLDKFVVLGALQAGPYLIHSKAPVEKLADLEGKRIRVSGAVQSDIVKAFKGVPVANIPANQIAENLSRNLLDAALVDMGNVYNFGIQDETKYHVTNLPLGSFAVLFLMNKDTYAKLDDKQKAAVDAVRGEWFTKTVGGDMDAQMHDVEKRLREDSTHHLVEFSADDLEKAKGLLQGVTDAWVKQNDANAAIYGKVSQ
ncbi:MAG: TRAP transporter substrate-binding protein DctP [Cardiobacteriaceae bacterium]|nr:TRAP transporter substrate-binding protein DctP [Cardiobacteriaceae bacterium]